MTELKWRPMHTKGGLTVWTCRSGQHHFATIRRDTDGLRVVRPSTIMPVKPGHMAELYADFAATVTPDLSASILAYGPNTTATDATIALGYINALETALKRHLI